MSRDWRLILPAMLLYGVKCWISAFRGVPGTLRNLRRVDVTSGFEPDYFV